MALGGVPGGNGNKKSLGDRASDAIEKAKKRADNKKDFDVMDPENTSSNGADLARQLAKTGKNIAKKILKAIWKVIKAIFKALAKHWIGWIIIAVIIIIVLVIAFFAMPGMMRDKLAELFTIDIAKYFQNGAVSALDKDYKDIVDVANYLESMGYNLIGDGFVTPIIKEGGTEDILSFEDVVDGHPEYVYKVGDDYRYHFYDDDTIVDMKYYNQYGKKIDNNSGDYLTIGDFTSMFGFKYFEGYIIDDENNVLHVQYQDEYGNVIDNWEQTNLSSATYMDEFGIIRKTPSGDNEEGQTTGELALFKDYFDDSDDIKEHAKHYDLIRSYLLSDYRIYTLKNDDEGILKKLGDIWREAFGGNKDAWTKGLIKLYNSKGGWATSTFAMHLGGGSLYNLFDGASMTKTSLSLSKGLANNAMTFSIEGWAPRYGMSLDFLLALHLGTNAPDLTYAMLQNFDTEIQVYLDEFSGKVNVRYLDPNDPNSSTMSPGDGDNMYSLKRVLTNWGWDTTAAYFDDYDTYTGLAEWLVNEAIDAKMAALFLYDGSLTLESPDNCNYPKYNSEGKRCDDENPNDHEACDVCLDYVKKVVKAMCSVGDSDYSSYQPYIARVVGSWFRDTYFIIPDKKDEAIKNYENDDHPEINMDNTWGKNAVLVRVDEEYLAEAGQYWSKYETNDDGSYKLYFLKANGETSGTTMEDFLATGIVDGVQMTLNGQPVTGYASKEEAETDGWAFVKKIETTTVKDFISSSEHTKGVSSSGSTIDNRVLWSAYTFSKTTTQTDWIKIKYDDNDSVDDVYDIAYGSEMDKDDLYTGMFYRLKKDRTIEQVEDAQRGETNTLIKYLFKYRKFYIYDGSTDRGMQIAHDKIRVLHGYSDYIKFDSDPTPGDEDNKGRYYLNKVAADEYSIKDAIQVDASITVDNFYTSWSGIISEDGKSGLLVDCYGSGWVGTVKGLLNDYGRSAIRKSYAWYTFDDTLDKDMLAEQWLDWQLDMYYMDKFGVDLPSYYDETSKSKDYFLKLEYDPRDPDLINTIQITKNSLNAFSILEATGSLDADYAYRDLKELIVELNYFDKEDLSDKRSKVFTWVMPQLESAGWPVRPWDKQDVEYGTLIESNETYKALTGNVGTTATVETDEEISESEMLSRLLELGESLGFNPEGAMYGYSGSTAELAHYIWSMSSQTASIDKLPEWFIKAWRPDSTAWATILRNQDDDYWGQYYNVNEIFPEWFFIKWRLAKTKSELDETLPAIYELDTRVHESSEYSDYESFKEYFMPKHVIEDKINAAAKWTFEAYLTADRINELPEWYYKWLDEEDRATWRTFRAAPEGDESVENEGSQSNTSTAMYFNGYTDGQLVASPVTGKIIEIGQHERINVYTGEPENVEYIIIQVMDGGTGNGSRGKTKSNYFENRMDSGNSFGYNSATSYEVAEALDLFYNEYSKVCDGYTIMIDGIDVDLEVQDEELEDEEIPTASQIKEAFDKQETYTIKKKDGKYTTNKVYGLYNSSERSKNQEKERAKADAPFYIRYGVSAEYPTSSGSSNGVYYKASESDPFIGYYVKEGKYIGRTIATKEATRTVEQGKITYTLADFVGVPAEYVRIQMNDTDNAVVEDIENFFNIQTVLIWNANAIGDTTAIEAITRDSSTEERIKAIMSYLISQGFTVEAAAGVCGNIAVECQYDERCNYRLDSTREQRGLCQWTYYTESNKGRWANVVNWITSQGYEQTMDNSTASFAGQVRAIGECESQIDMVGETNWNRIKSATDEKLAARYWDQWYEIGNDSREIRESEATAALNVWNGGTYSGNKPYRGN